MRSALVAGFVALAMVVGPSVAVSSAAASSGPGASVHAQTGTFTYAFVSWNGAGHNISSANKPSSAFVLKPGENGHANFSFEFSAGSIPSGSSASLQMTYLGLVLTTSKASLVGSLLQPGKGTAEVNFSFGPLVHALEGVFEITAGILSSSGAAYWSESFYVFAKAPYLLESAAVVVLLILLVAESYEIAAALRDAKRTPPSAPSGQPAPGGPPGGSPAGTPAASGPPAAAGPDPSPPQAPPPTSPGGAS